jgi:hypothetical protein
MVRYKNMAESMRNRRICGDVGEWLETGPN